MATTGTNPVTLDLDASLVEIHSENKEGAAPHFKGGFGFHTASSSSDAQQPSPMSLPTPAVNHSTGVITNTISAAYPKLRRSLHE